MIKDACKIIIYEIFKLFQRFFFLFPIKENRVIFCSYGGKQYSDSPKCIFERLLDKNKNDFDCIWVLNQKHDLSQIRNVKQVIPMSLRFYYYLYTSKVLISNDCILPFIIKRKKQIYIQTWHGGGAYKKTGYASMKRYSHFTLDNLSRELNLYDYFVSSCKMFTKCNIEEAFHYKGNILEIGLPRNDGLIHKSNLMQQLDQKAESSTITILYAPTFRNNLSFFQNQIDIDAILETVKLRFGKDVNFVYRTHHKMNKLEKQKENVVDGNSYEDVLELLEVSDIIITDYSSIIWDAAVSKKICFVYAPDRKQYEENNDFFVPMDLWPFPIAHDNNELVEIIKKFDYTKYIASVDKHLENMGSYENGKSTDKIVDIIIHSTIATNMN